MQHDSGGPADRPRKRGQGELENQVLAVLGEAPGPVTASWVQERHGGDLAYTTVMTILSRLLAKQAVSRGRDGRSYVWSAASDAAGLTARRMRRLLDTETDRASALVSFVSALSQEDEQVLRALLDASTGDPDAAAPDERER
ncbi:BlaI/MecI/CopY family transcriptional regulator [Kitasatospora sp. McL0602]|uniref:BlaI/MecI/CopY family transcriptional regulator n=1 Tax=Kitasatospora sp. McL0602 TaxID=3439530 RepID=UPI003F8B4B4D